MLLVLVFFYFLFFWVRVGGSSYQARKMKTKTQDKTIWPRYAIETFISSPIYNSEEKYIVFG